MVDNFLIKPSGLFKTLLDYFLEHFRFSSLKLE